MANQVININRKKFAAGLFWQPAGAGVLATRFYARNLARGVDKRLNLYTDYRSMVGLGARKNGARAGMISAAADVMDAFSEYTSFLAVFQHDKIYYLVAARNGIIIQDTVFDDEAAARDEYVKLSEIPDWGAFFAPGAWGMPRAAERNLADILTGASRATLHSISRANTWMLSGVLMAIFVIAMVAIFRDPVVQMMTPQAPVAEIDPELVAEYKRQIEEKNKELDAQFEIEKTLPPEPIVMPYELLPDPMARAELCYQAIGFVMQPVVGWNQKYAECGEEFVVADMQRSFGTLGEFYSQASDLMPGVTVTEINEDTVRVRATLPGLDVYASQDERDAETIVRDLTTRFQGVDSGIDVQIVTDTLTNGVDVAYVDVVELATSSKLIPQQFMKIFDDFGGVYMTQCAWDATTRTWNYEVIIYAK
ncbi:MAG: type 4b pilus protein PilO2 [Alphaproteobacteria bacterium]|nr:type 4b pilus protein PilO2 [Alphaproteobacteria bacterium]